MLHSFHAKVGELRRLVEGLGISAEGFPVYYEEMARKKLSLASCDFLALLGDTMMVDGSTKFLQPVLLEDTPMEDFVHLVEADRRARKLRSDKLQLPECSALKYCAHVCVCVRAHGSNTSGGCCKSGALLSGLCRQICSTTPTISANIASLSRPTLRRKGGMAMDDGQGLLQ